MYNLFLEIIRRFNIIYTSNMIQKLKFEEEVFYPFQKKSSVGSGL